MRYPDYSEYNENIDSNYEPIYYRQIVTLKRISKIPIDIIVNMSAGEANSAISSIQKRYMVKTGWRVNNLKLKGHMEEVVVSAQVSGQYVSASIQVWSVPRQLE